MRRALFILLPLLAGCGDEPELGFEATAGGARQEPYVAVPAGAVPRGASVREAVLEPPGPPVTPALLRAGARIYRDACAPCHGARGRGDGPVVEKGYPRPEPFHVTPQPPAEIVRIVTEGQAQMPSLAEQVRPVERWAVAYYVAGALRDGE